MMVVFRTDASDLMGTGHLTRSVALADALIAQGAQVEFICRAHRGHLIGLLHDKGLHVSELPAPHAGGSPVGEDYSEWLGVPQAVDASETMAALSGRHPDWLVVDHYGLGALWERQLRPHARKILAIDDLADRERDCDLLLDQTYADPGVRRHDGLVSPSCRLLLGPRYALLAPQYASYRQRMAPRDGQIRRVLVYFGGSDSRNMTGLVLAALSAPEFSHLEADVVIGANGVHRIAVERQAALRPRTHTHGTRPHLADLMAHADLAIGAGGVTNWERMCLGLPSLVICLANNQRSTCEGLSAAGLIEYAGDADVVGEREIAAALTKLIGHPDLLMSMSVRGLESVDGQGAMRVASEMAGHT